MKLNVIALSGRYATCHFQNRKLTCNVLIGRNVTKRTFHDIAKNIGLQFDQMPYMAGWVQEAGFTEVKEHERLIPIGPWPKSKRQKEVGLYYRIHLLEGGESNLSCI